YELLFVPIRAEDKRVAKLVIDTLLERVADAAGALVLIALVAAGVERFTGVLVAVLAAAALWLVPRVRRGYVETLGKNLADRAPALDDLRFAVDSDATARHTLHLTLGDLAQGDLRERLSQTSR